MRIHSTFWFEHTPNKVLQFIWRIIRTSVFFGPPIPVNGRGLDRITINHLSKSIFTLTWLTHAFQKPKCSFDFDSSDWMLYCTQIDTHTHIQSMKERNSYRNRVLYVIFLCTYEFVLFPWSVLFVEGSANLVYLCLAWNDKCAIKLCAHFNPSICWIIRFWMIDVHTEILTHFAIGQTIFRFIFQWNPAQKPFTINKINGLFVWVSVNKRKEIRTKNSSTSLI